MFDTILIANRGEIACRVMQTAQAMGIRCVAVHSDIDREARHVDMADQAVCIGGAAPADSYLRGDAIIAAALDSGAQAIHPGYGFLSENPDFVDAVEAAGLTFIGPSASAIRAMGLKDAAKTLMEEAGVPIVPGYQGGAQDADTLAREADRIGFPLLIKAVAGGGGKGMRLVDSAQDFRAALTSAQNEARAAFGNADVLLEIFVQQPRHIEVQVFSDGERAVHLFERDCSLQRRHQKVIEEAPAPGMTDEMRYAMGQAAVRAAEAIGYKGAGTIEFIVDALDGLRPDRFYFMEMNTRLQVEHPVTEAITGVDLVEWQLRVAAGEPLPQSQEELHITGHAFEARLYAEDVAGGFLPATGKLAHLEFAKGARIDTAVRPGDEISPWYDPMIAKLTVHGPTRAIALGRLRSALDTTQVAGTVTNLAFLGALARHEGFAAGNVDTGLIARDLQNLTDVPPVSDLQIMSAVLNTLDIDGADPQTGFTLWTPLTQRVTLKQAETTHDVSLSVRGRDHVTMTVNATTYALRRVADTWAFEGRKLPPAVRYGHAVTVLGAVDVVFDLIDPLAQESSTQNSGDDVIAPMPGLVRAVFANLGQDVRKGDALAVLEAMKMEHTLTALRDGHVAEVCTEPGSQVNAGDLLIRLAPQEEAET